MKKTYKDIAEAVKAGTISLDFCGHRTNMTKEWFIERYEDTLAMANGKNDGNWSDRDGKSIEEVDASMRDFYQSTLDWEANPHDPHNAVGGFFGPGSDGEYCFECGGNFRFMFNGSDKICLRQYFDGKNYALADRCEFEHRKPMKGQIQVASPLMFLNFVRIQDCPEEKEYSEEWSLNSTRGRTNIFTYKWKEQNIAYGQLTNCSYGIFVHPSKKSIIIGNPYVADRIIDELPEEEVTTDKQYKSLQDKYSKIEDHELVGTICCDVWRWEAVDVATLNRLFDNDYIQKISDQQFQLDVPHGTWSFVHYYDTRTSDNEDVWARLTLD